MKVGIDTLSFYTSRYALDLATLAKARGIETDKYYIGLGQRKMAVPPPDEDIVTMAANAADRMLRQVDRQGIDTLLFATESGIDQSKSAGVYVHELLGLPMRCRVVELKQACYSGTMAIQMALPMLRQNPEKKILVIASDIARYGLNTPGESSQGAGAIAMLLTANPRLLAIEPDYGVVTESVMDFWRPNFCDEAFVDGKYSSRLYLTMLEKCWAQYTELSRRTFQDHAAYCYHTPVPRLVEKAHQYLAKLNGLGKLSEELIQEQMSDFLHYGRVIGNSYTASLYMGLASLLENTERDFAGERLGFYSYGSGCVAEFFSGVVQAGYREVLDKTYHQQQIAARRELSYSEYETFYTFAYPKDGSYCQIPEHETGKYRLAEIKDNKRVYAGLSNAK